MGRRYYRRTRRRYRSSRGSLGGWIFLLILGALSQMKIETVIFYTILIVGIGLTGFYLYKRHKRNIILESGIDIVDHMDGVKFEELLLVHFQKQGYKGHLTSATNDYGADLVIDKDGDKVVVQAKRWKQTVGIEAVQQAIGAIKHYNVTRGMVITNSSFTQQARNLATSNKIELWDRETLIRFLRSSNGRDMAESIFSLEGDSHTEEDVQESSIENCPSCGKQLTVRKGKNGSFIGCSGFPVCRYTKAL